MTFSPNKPPIRYPSGAYSKLTFGHDDSVEIDNSEFKECNFRDCELIGDGWNFRTSRCQYQGRAANKILQLMALGRGPVEIMF